MSKGQFFGVFWCILFLHIFWQIVYVNLLLPMIINVKIQKYEEKNFIISVFG